MSMLYHVTAGDRTLEVDLRDGETTVDGEPFTSSLARIPDTRIYSMVLDGRSYRLACRRREGGSWEIHLGGQRATLRVVDERTRAIQEMTGTGAATQGARSLRAPMPGLVVKVEVEEGQEVEPGDGLVVVEAMKMENELRATAPGRIERILVSEGDAVEKDDVLVEFEPPGEE